jgi:HSP20 family protein
MAKPEVCLPIPGKSLSQEVDRLFDELIHRRWGAQPETQGWPQLDLSETEEAFLLEADLPGVKEKDVAVTIEGRDLVLRGQRVVEQTTTRANFSCHERRSGQFMRRLPLPVSVDQDHIRAEFQDGILSVTLPKSAKTQSGEASTERSRQQ